MTTAHIIELVFVVGAALAGASIFDHLGRRR